MDDTEGGVQAQLSSDQHLSQLNLGSVVRIPDNQGRTDKRGEGFELRTDAHGVVRAKDGLLITTEAKPNASGHIKSMAETTARLDQAQQAHEQLADLAKQHQAQEDGQQDAVAKALEVQNKAIKGEGPSGSGSGSADAQAGKFPEFAQPHLTLASPAGIQATTPGSTHLHSGESLAVTTGQSVSVATKGGLFASIANAVRVFVYEGGIKWIAAKDNIEAHALKDNIRLSAKLNITHTAERITLAATKRITLNGGGSQGTWQSGSIVYTTAGNYTVLANSAQVTGKGTSQTATPNAQTAFDQKVLLRLPTGQPAANREYKLTKKDGSVITGKTGADGSLPHQNADWMEGATVHILGSSLP